ncbi:MAG: InlB B-repeat-containing protein [Clostridiales Family XIII bacterium]|nr:InlB B-repeat-containing protein [Clostridiales Family XIII bacterium]
MDGETVKTVNIAIPEGQTETTLPPDAVPTEEEINVIAGHDPQSTNSQILGWTDTSVIASGAKQSTIYTTDEELAQTEGYAPIGSFVVREDTTFEAVFPSVGGVAEGRGGQPGETSSSEDTSGQPPRQATPATQRRSGNSGDDPESDDIGALSTDADGNELTLKVGTADGFVDVDSLPTANALTWAMTYGNRQIQVTVNFADKSEKTRSVEIEIPRGLKILEYTAKSGIDVAGVNEMNLSDEDDAKIVGSALTALDGTSSWVNQRIGGYTAISSATVTPYHNADGKVAYTFNSGCDKIVLTLTLGIDSLLLPHAPGSTADLNNINVHMVSGSVFLDEHLKTTISQANPLDTVFSAARPSTNLEGIVDADNSNVGVFPAFSFTFSFDSGISTNNHFTEQRTTTISYPEGITFVGFNATAVAQNHPTDSNGGSYGNGRLVVVHNTDTRTITFTYNDFYDGGNGSGDLTCYWAGVVDNDIIHWGDSINISATTTMSAGALIGDVRTDTRSASINFTIGKPMVNIEVVAMNRHKADLNADGLYPYDYALSGFIVTNSGPSIAKELTYSYEFSPKLAVRALALHGKSSNTYKDLIAHTNTGREIKVTGAISIPRSMEDNCFDLRAEQLGLGANEFLLDLKITQNTLNVAVYGPGYTFQGGNYYGRFQGGETGSATLTITDEDGATLATATDTPVIEWTMTNMRTFTTTPSHSSTSTVGGSFYPGEAMYINGVVEAGYHFGGNGVFSQMHEIVDPTIYINLPAGIDLDVSSVRVNSPAGNNGSSKFAPNLVSSQKKLVNGVEWTSYKFTANHLDIIANSFNMGGNGVKSTGVGISFTAYVSSACNAYPAISTGDILQLDLGKTNVNGGRSDLNNWTGKGTGYGLATSGNTNIAVVQKPGLTVSLGIKVSGDTGPYYTYNGTDASIAAVTQNSPAEVYLKYENTSTDTYAAGSEIYLPIPKSAVAYDKYFNNKETSDPDNSPDNVAPDWDGKLTGPITLPGFTTYYTTDTTGDINNDPESLTWTPVPGSIPWSTSATDYGLVTMVKFVANVPIASAGNAGSIGDTTFNIEVDSLGETNYWRSYQKGWRDGTGNGTWVYGSVLAAEPAVEGIRGKIFDDKNADGIKAATGEDFAALSSVRATLTSSTGAISAINVKVDADGTIQPLTSAGDPYYLKMGTYTLTIYDENTQRGFTTTTPTTPSSTTGGGSPVDTWYMDIAQANVASSHASASYTFEIDETDIEQKLVGVGLKDAALVTYTKDTGADFNNVTEYKNHNQLPTASVVPSFSTGTNTITGYNPATAVWMANKPLYLGSNVVPTAANTALSRAQVLSAHITEDVTFTASLSLYSYDVHYALAKGILDVSIDNPEEGLHWDDNISLPATAKITRPGYTFSGWKLTKKGSSAFDGGIYAAGTTPAYATLAGADTVNSLTFTATWVIDETATDEEDNPIWAKVFFNGNGSDGGTVPSYILYNLKELDWADDTEFPSDVPTRTGYIYGGWNTLSDGSGDGVTDLSTLLASVGPITADKTVYAKWTADYDAEDPGTNEKIWVTVDFDVNGGAETLPQLHWNKSLGAFSDGEEWPEDATRSGYSFVEWNDDIDGTGTAYTNASAFAENTTVYAKWAADYDAEDPDTNEKIWAKVSFDTKGGTGTFDTLHWNKALGAYSDGEKWPTDKPVRIGYDFVNWNNANGTGSAYTKDSTFTKDTTVYAKWKINEGAKDPETGDPVWAKVSFNATEGKGAPAAILFNLSEEKWADGTKFPSGKPTRTGYKFTEWNKDASGKGTAVNSLTGFGTITGNTELYAQWAPDYSVKSYWKTISYDGNGHSAGIAPESATLAIHSSVSVKGAGTLARDGYTFLGWSTDANGNVTHSVSQAITLDDHLQLFAVWEQNAQPPQPPVDPPQPPVVNHPPQPPVVDPPQPTVDKLPEPKEPEAPKPSDPSSTTSGTETSRSFTGFTAEAQQKLEAQTGNVFSDLGNGNVPLGSFFAKGAWSLLSAVMSIAAVVISLILAVGALARRRREDEHRSVNTYGYEDSEKRRRHGKLLKALTCLAGVATLMVWIILDDFSQPMAWVNSWTLFVGLVFIVQIALLVIYKLRSAGRDSEYEESVA